ncbi:sigma-70 family RNA polymerase sigma factor [Amycolatopsis saalfeldensis]|uniref:RNA polymerase sigma-70 factor, ECF subfamily n=1 Tax=Amycolatopsis saalfeldensis TaxID=394193 RepID=A0A1H8YHN7_9PSEU|nr:sigma-70 family RNA polymerase sigma factor [Amycolatopsis saalfeldensis]SEP50958.1 RNA polymerase sigma-70 factor, ECF subfamily [Amycolatopsis saalfeldensis]
MPEDKTLALRFEAERPRLRALAHRLLGSAAEAEDAVQEAWLRLARHPAGSAEPTGITGAAGTAGIANLAAWLTTVVSRVCLDALRARRETPFEQVPEHGVQGGPEDEVVRAGEVGRALLVVLATLTPAERVAFVLHDLFAVPFDAIAPIVDRTPVAAKKLASRARLRVRGTPALPEAELARHAQVVQAFLAAARGGDLAELLRVLAPDVVRGADPATLPAGAPPVLRGADAVARGTQFFSARAALAELALVDGRPGLVLAPAGRLTAILRITVADDLVTAYEVVIDPGRLAGIPLALLEHERADV